MSLDKIENHSVSNTINVSPPIAFDLWFHIISNHLSLTDFPRMFLLNKSFKALFQSDKMWKSKYGIHFPHLYEAIQGQNNVNWYQTFKQTYLTQYKNLTPEKKKIFTLIKEEERERLKSMNFGQGKLRDLHYLTDSDNNSVEKHLVKYASQSYRNFIFNNFIVPFYQHDPKKRDIFNYTLLHWCIKLNQTDLVKKLIHEEAYGVDEFIDLNSTPLILSAQVGNRDLVDFLLNLNADVNATGQGIYTALSSAISHGHTLIVERLLECKTITLDEGSLVNAAKRGFIDIVTLLVNRDNSTINSANYPGETPLRMAAIKGHVDVVKLLLQSGASIKDCTSALGKTLLMSLVEKNKDTSKNGINILSILLNYSSEDDALIAFPGRAWGNKEGDPNIGDTVLHIAAAQGNIEAYKLLSTSFPKLVAIRNCKGQTALDLAPTELKPLFLETCAQQNSIRLG